jgi:hypothetical protein
VGQYELTIPYCQLPLPYFNRRIESNYIDCYIWEAWEGRRSTSRLANRRAMEVGMESNCELKIGYRPAGNFQLGENRRIFAVMARLTVLQLFPIVMTE